MRVRKVQLVEEKESPTNLLTGMEEKDSEVHIYRCGVRDTYLQVWRRERILTHILTSVEKREKSDAHTYRCGGEREF